MPKLPRNVKAKRLLKALKKLGFVEAGTKGSHVRVKHSDGRWTQVAVHQKPIPPGTLRAIIRQAGISVEDLLKILK